MKSLKDPTGTCKRRYGTYKSKLNRLLINSERKHYEELLLFDIYRNDLSRSWQVMKDIINKKIKRKCQQSTTLT